MTPADRIAVAFDAASQHLADDGDRRALVLALAEHMPPEGVAELLARLIECHPEGAELVRRQEDGGPSYKGQTEMHGLMGGLRSYVYAPPGRKWMLAGVGQPETQYPTREAAEAALIAAQPVPAAVVRVRS